MTRGTGEHGQAVPLALLVVALTLVLTMAVARLAGDVAAAGRARTAADAAALAGATDGRAGAARLAAANGAELVGWRVDGETVTVVVIVGDARATARATTGP